MANLVGAVSSPHPFMLHKDCFLSLLHVWLPFAFMSDWYPTTLCTLYPQETTPLGLKLCAYGRAVFANIFIS